jgi:hypothetical protein
MVPVKGEASEVPSTVKKIQQVAPHAFTRAFQPRTHGVSSLTCRLFLSAEASVSRPGTALERVGLVDTRCHTSCSIGIAVDIANGRSAMLRRIEVHSNDAGFIGSQRAQRLNEPVGIIGEDVHVATVEIDK